MKKAIIAVLVCVNAGLLVALILGAGVPQAKAYNGALLQNNTIMMTGQVDASEDALFVIDMASETLKAFEFKGTASSKRIRPLGSRDLKIDLK
jgi:hypothetical protein